MMSPGDAVEDDNPFVSMLRDSVAGLDEVIPFSWAHAYRGGYQVLHVQWPELIVAHRIPAVALVKKLAFCLLITLNLFRRIAMVATVHNLAPHTRTGLFGGATTMLWYRHCVARIYLTKAGADAAMFGPGIHIQHGDYAPYIAKFPPTSTERKPYTLLNFGHVKRYKGLEGAIRSLTGQSKLHLLIAGRCTSEAYAAELESLAATSGSISLDLRAIGSAELVTTIRSVSAVILPYSAIYNSGAALLALTLGTPIIVTDSSSMRELQAEVGPEWVQILPELWTLAHLEDAFRRVSERPESYPSFRARDWEDVAIAHHACYLHAVALTRAASQA
jgi:beta-1,4-mannosyltransferase